MNEIIYVKALIAQLATIVANISIDEDGDLVDKGIGENNKIKDLLKSFNIILYEKIDKQAEYKFLLTNWIYIYYYQQVGRSTVPVSNTELDAFDFPFNVLDIFNDCYWRSAFWEYLTDDTDFSVIALTQGYDTKVLNPKQYVEDSCLLDSKAKKSFKFLSVILPKFEINPDHEKFAFGQFLVDDDSKGGVIRFYINLNPSLATEAVRHLVYNFFDYFNERLIPFTIKFWANSKEFERADNFVVYFERRHFFIASILLNYLYEYKGIKHFVRNYAPAFVFPIKTGLGFAKSPTNRTSSFGVERSKLIAQQVIENINKPDCLETILKTLNEKWNGIEGFYLNPKPTFSYTFELFSENNLIIDKLAEVSQDKYLQAAMYIAFLLCKEATWFKFNECNWTSYQLLDLGNKQVGQCGYSFLAVDNGISGLESVVVFLEAFSKIQQYDSVIALTARAARKHWEVKQGISKITFSESHTTLKESEAFFDQLAENKPTNTSQNFIEFSEFKSEVRALLGELDTIQLSDFPTVDRFVDVFISSKRPIINLIDGSTNFCADMESGLAGFGYTLLRLYDPRLIPAIVLNG